MDNEFKSDFCIEIDFDKNSENPSRVFQTMSDLIKSFQILDRDLIRGIDSRLEPVIMLEDVESGSIRSYLLNKIKGVPDEAIKDGDWKKILGHFLVKSKYIIIKHLEGKTQITDAKFIEGIQMELMNEAEKSDIKQFPYYSPIRLPKLVSNIDNINKSIQNLSGNDKAIIKSEFGNATFNLELDFTASNIEDLITKERIESETIMILKVKKPDYLGNSMWDFKLGSKLIQAKILHSDWLRRFQEREIDIRPGDSIRCNVKTTAKYGYDFELIANSYEVITVLEILRNNTFNQNELDLDV